MNVIDKARERIERYGWWQLNGSSKGRGYCVLTALAAEGEKCPDAWQAIVAEIDEPRTILPDHAIAQWNDDPSTTLEDVLLVMKRASARLDEEVAR